MFLARTATQQEELNHDITVNLLETEYYNIEHEPNYGEVEEINFIGEDDEEPENSQETSDFA